MRTLKLLQIGDVHFPTNSTLRTIDEKDESVSVLLRDSIAVNPFQIVIRRILRLLGEEHFAAVLLCGDLTNFGDISGYRQCLEYLRRIMDAADSISWDRQSLHVVPGNHDIDRENPELGGNDIFNKFDALDNEWRKINLPILASRKVRETTVGTPRYKAKLYSVNSCIGCGEGRSLPEQIRSELQSLLSNYIETQPLEESFELVGEQLDTPAFHIEQIDSITESIDRLDRNVVPVVLTHHNLLPQTIPRVALYTEVINGGTVRARLIECKKPVIYCHGHIHDDPVEIIASPNNLSGPLVSVSAPEIVRGFNVIEVHFSKKNILLGCSILPYRIENHGGVEIQERTIKRISFCTPSEFPHLGNEFIVKILKDLDFDSVLRFNELLKAVRKSQNTNIHQRTLADSLLEAEWFNLIRINNRSDEFRFWTIRRITP